MLTSKEYQSMDGMALAHLVKLKEVSAVELLECALKEMDRQNPQLNAVVMRNDDDAYSQAKAADISLPFGGVPFLAKDINVAIKHYRTTHACRFFSNAPVSQTDSILVERWRRAGLIICGRTNTPEFATDFGCEPELYGPTNNPWDLSLTPGGSSGGAAAAVSSGMVPIAHGSDSGGSIRAPAACCGLFGFKPSGGLVATGSPLGPLVAGLNSDHVLTRTVRDSALMLDLTAGSEYANPTIFNKPEASYIESIQKTPSALRIGVTHLSPIGTTASKTICNKLNQTVRLLESLGHNIVHWQWPEKVDPSEVASIFWTAELAAVIEQHASTIGRSPEINELGPLVYSSWIKAKSINAIDLVNARMRMREIQASLYAAQASVDVLLTPTIAEAPLPTGFLTDLAGKDVDEWMSRAWGFAPYLEIFNVTGQPAMSVPLHWDDDGLPVGMHFATRIGDDALLLQLAKQLENAAPWHERIPPYPKG